MGKGLFEKAGRIQIPAVRPSEGDSPAVGSAAPGKPRTAPGTLAGFMAAQSEAIKENERLRDRLSDFEGAVPVRLVDPRVIRSSRWANRHESTYSGLDFAALKAEIAQAGGNVQPIKIRPLAHPVAEASSGVGPSNPSEATSEEGKGLDSPTPPEFEVVFGHRRHRACLELGLPVLAMVEALSEQDLFVQMERENRNRADLSAWEQGAMYAKALDGGLYPSNRQLAAAIGRDVGDVGKALALARLPKVVIDAFATPLDLQFRWAKPLSDAQQRDPELLLTRAKSLHGSKLPPKKILEALTSTSESNGAPPAVTLERDGKAVATISTDNGGKISIKLHVRVGDAIREKLVKAIDKLL